MIGPEEGPAGALLLDRYANNSSPRNTRDETPRQRRYRRQRVVREISGLRRVCACGRVIVDPRGVGLRKTAEGIVGMSGLATCGSVWVCPPCNAKVMARRALEIGAAVTTWETRGGRIGFVTMTMRHNAGQALADLWGALAYAWGKVTSGKAWTVDQDRFGLAGWVRVVEVTLTWDNGWHVHVHALVFLEEGRDELDLVSLHHRMFLRWSRALQRKGLDAPLMAGQDARLISGASDDRLAQYLTKARDDASIGLELVHSQSKIARTSHSSFTPWELLTLVDEAQSEEEFLRAFEAWREWEEASHGRRQMGWSKGLRDLVGLNAEKTDEEVAEEVVGEETDTVVYITPRGWDAVMASPQLVAVILDTLDLQGPAALKRLLSTHAIDFEEV